MKREMEFMSSENYEIWITYNSNKKRLQIPVLPEEIRITYPDKDDKVYVYELGEATIKNHPGAFVMKWNSFFPAYRCQGSIKKPKQPKHCVEFLKKAMKLKTPVKIIFTGGPMKINSLCTIKFDEKEVGGDKGTIHYSIVVTEFKKPKIRKIKIKGKKAKYKNNSKRNSNRIKPSRYVVKKGDCLWNIAKKYYGKGSDCTLIYNANKKVIGSNRNLIYAGQILVLP